METGIIYPTGSISFYSRQTFPDPYPPFKEKPAKEQQQQSIEGDTLINNPVVF